MSNFANPQEDTNVLRLILAAGTEALPSVVFASDLTKGLSWTPDGLRLSGLADPINDDDAANKAYVDGASPSPSFPLLAPDGTNNAPSYAFSSDPTTGLYFDPAIGIQFSCGGVLTFDLEAGGAVLNTQLDLNFDGTSTLMSLIIGSGVSGIYAPTPDSLGFSAGTGSGNIQAVLQLDKNMTANETSMLLWDVTAATLQRVSIGAADSGGTGFRVLRIPN